MVYKKMPKNRDILSILGFGCMRLQTKEGQIDENRALSFIGKAVLPFLSAGISESGFWGNPVGSSQQTRHPRQVLNNH